jgi:hypothetical protein
VVAFDQCAHDGEPQTVATGLTVARVVGAIEAFKNLVAKLGRNSFTVVANLDYNALALDAQSNIDSRILWCEP